MLAAEETNFEICRAKENLDDACACLERVRQDLAKLRDSSLSENSEKALCMNWYSINRALRDTKRRIDQAIGHADGLVDRDTEWS